MRSILLKNYFFRSLIIIITAILIFCINTSYFNKHRTSLYLEKEILTKEMKNSIHEYIFKNNEISTLLIYEKLSYKPIWTKNYELTPLANNFLNILKNHMYYGILNSSEYDYLTSLFKNVEKSKNKEELINNRTLFEIETTKRFINFINFVVYGNNKNANTENILNKKYFQTLIVNALQRNELTMLPDLLIYKTNKNLYNLHLALRNFINNIKIDTTTININNNDEQKIKIEIIEYFTKNEYNNEIFNDSTLTESIKRYQKYSGLEVTGNLDKRTIRSLKNSTFYLYCKISLNIERYKSFNPADSFYIWINLPSYNLKVIKNDSIIKEFKVIIGKKETPTPILKTNMNSIIINPEWVVPPAIFEKEFIKILQKDKTYFHRNNFYVKNISDTIDIHVILEKRQKIKIAQKPGEKNALGKVKFNLNNPYQIYIHDTPSKHLFKNETRAYSHGCIRIEKAEELAQILIDNFHIKDVKLKELLNKNETKVIFLPSSIPVYITYFTCYADKNANLYVYEDIYNYDEELIKVMQMNQSNFNIMN